MGDAVVDPQTGQTTFAVDVGGGEVVRYSVHVDPETGLDICPHSGRLMTREESIENVKEVYAVGREALGADLARYNEWIRRNPGKEEKLFGGANGSSAMKSASGSTTRAADPSPRTLLSHQIRDLSADADALKVKGNAALQRGAFHDAVKCYTEGLALDDGNIALWANRSEANLKLQRFPSALQDARKALILSHPQPHEKCLFRVVRALRGLHLYRQAHAEALRGLAQFPEHAATWQPVVEECAALPLLLLESVGDSAELPAGSRGRCAIRAVDAVRPPTLAGCEAALGDLPVHVAYRLADGDRAPSPVTALIVATAVIRTARCANMDGGGQLERLVQEARQYGELLGMAFDIGHDDAGLSLVEMALDAAETLWTEMGDAAARTRSAFQDIFGGRAENLAEVLATVGMFVVQCHRIETLHANGLVFVSFQVPFLSSGALSRVPESETVAVTCSATLLSADQHEPELTAGGEDQCAVAVLPAGAAVRIYRSRSCPDAPFGKYLRLDASAGSGLRETGERLHVDRYGNRTKMQ